MKQDYKEELYLQFYYGECDLFERLEIENELETNVRANHQYATFYSGLLDQLKTLSPKQSSIDKILAYAKS